MSIEYQVHFAFSSINQAMTQTQHLSRHWHINTYNLKKLNVTAHVSVMSVSDIDMYHTLDMPSIWNISDTQLSILFQSASNNLQVKINGWYNVAIISICDV